MLQLTLRTDTIFYRIFKDFPRVFFELIGQPPTNARLYEFSSVELKQTAFRIDGVFTPVQETAQLPVYFLEVQFQTDPQFYRRFFAEIFLYLRQNPNVILWRAVMVYAQRSNEPNDFQPYQALLNSPQVQRIYLNELELQPSPSLGLLVLQLIVETEDQAINRARTLITRARQELDERTRQEILDLIETIIFYKLTRLTREEIREMLVLTESEFKQSRLYQSIREEVFEEGKQAGFEEGRQEGRQELLVEIATNLLQQGLSLEQVARMLNLEIDQVRAMTNS